MKIKKLAKICNKLCQRENETSGCPFPFGHNLCHSIMCGRKNKEQWKLNIKRDLSEEVLNRFKDTLLNSLSVDQCVEILINAEKEKEKVNNIA